MGLPGAAGEALSRGLAEVDDLLAIEVEECGDAEILEGELAPEGEKFLNGEFEEGGELAQGGDAELGEELEWGVAGVVAKIEQECGALVAGEVLDLLPKAVELLAEGGAQVGRWGVGGDGVGGRVERCVGFAKAKGEGKRFQKSVEGKRRVGVGEDCLYGGGEIGSGNREVWGDGGGGIAALPEETAGEERAIGMRPEAITREVLEEVMEAVLEALAIGMEGAEVAVAGVVGHGGDVGMEAVEGGSAAGADVAQARQERTEHLLAEVFGVGMGEGPEAAAEDGVDERGGVLREELGQKGFGQGRVGD